MNESDLEAKLALLRPARPSAGLEDRIFSALSAPESIAMPQRAMANRLSGILSRPGESWFGRLAFGLGWALGGAAAAVIAISYLGPIHRSEAGSAPASSVAVQPAAAVFEPVESERQVVSTGDALIFDEQDQPTQYVRYSSVERHSWTNAATGAEIVVEAPREDIMIVPASFQ